MFVAVSILILVLTLASLIGIVFGVRKKNKILLVMASILYTSLIIFTFGAYGIDIGGVFMMIGELGIAIGAGLKLKKMWIPSIILVLILILMSSLVACSSNNEIKNDIESSTMQFMCLISNVDEKNSTITFDKIEWITLDDIDRIKALGLNEQDDFPSGFYIYNESIQNEQLKFIDEPAIYILQGPNYTKEALTDILGLSKRISEHEAPYVLSVKAGEITGITEQYRP